MPESETIPVFDELRLSDFAPSDLFKDTAWPASASAIVEYRTVPYSILIPRLP
jgi:hypothetical protein